MIKGIPIMVSTDISLPRANEIVMGLPVIELVKGVKYVTTADRIPCVSEL